MKKFKETNKALYEISRKDKLALDMALISEAGNDMCSVPLEKLKSKVMRDRHKKMCMIPKKSIWSKAARSGVKGLYNSLEEDQSNLVILIQDITRQMIQALQRGDERKLKGLYKNLGKVIK
jgi:hypothetical protein